MTRILLSGHGRMGRCLEELIAEAPDLALAGVLGETDPLPPADVIIDFSAPGNLPRLAEAVGSTGAALVCGTTGYSAEEQEVLEGLGARAPVLWSANFSVGVAVLRQALGRMAEALGETWDIEITETHHNQKADAPSGTARLLLAAVDPEGKHTPVCGREGLVGKRSPREIGLHSLRGGTVAGEHTVSFFGDDEVVEITHKAASRRIFALGALRAARALAGKPRGVYTLEDLLFGKEG